MRKDLRETGLFREAEALYRALGRPGGEQVSDASEICASPDGRHAVFTGTFVEKLDGVPSTRICRIDLQSGKVCVLTSGSGLDRLAKYSPNGRHIAFLSDRHNVGDFQLHLLDPLTGAVECVARVDGWVEYFHWSPDGGRILLGVAGHGVDVSSGQGAVTRRRPDKSSPPWLPTVQGEQESHQWRRAWVCDLNARCTWPVNEATSNAWEANWCGANAVAAVVSPSPGEGLWYSARLQVLDAQSGSSREIYVPKRQLGWPCASPSGRHLAFVEAISSDRGNVVGDLSVIETETGSLWRVDTRGVNVAAVEWRSDRTLLLAGVRGFETVVGLYDVFSTAFEETWASTEISTAGPCVGLSGIGDGGDCVLVGEGFVRAPEIALLHRRQYRVVRSFDLGYASEARSILTPECVTWEAPDGLEIQGWCLRPNREGPHALVTYIHGGPVSHWRQAWLGRPRLVPLLMLLKRGCAVFLPNPRGSSGRGQEFARRVVGDLCGDDTQDCLSGVDYLVAKGIANPRRLGVMGVSYGGTMASWLIAHDSRFSAAVSVAPAVNRVSQRLTCAHTHFVDLFLNDRYNNPGGRYFLRSPVMHAHRVRTPILNICGALDRCTPPSEARQFHNALLENGTVSSLVTYPEEGHGIRKFPAVIDYAARVVGWLETYLCPGREFAASSHDGRAAVGSGR